jgi:hypothetical protein
MCNKGPNRVLALAIPAEAARADLIKPVPANERHSLVFQGFTPTAKLGLGAASWPTTPKPHVGLGYYL